MKGIPKEESAKSFAVYLELLKRCCAGHESPEKHLLGVADESLAALAEHDESFYCESVTDVELYDSDDDPHPSQVVCTQAEGDSMKPKNCTLMMKPWSLMCWRALPVMTKRRWLMRR